MREEGIKRMRKTIAFWSASVAGLMWVNGAEAQTVLSNQYLEVNGADECDG